MKKKIGKATRSAKSDLVALKSPRPRRPEAGVVFSLRLSAEELEQLRDSAAQERMTVSDLIRRRVFQPNFTNVFVGHQTSAPATPGTWGSGDHTESSANR